MVGITTFSSSERAVSTGELALRICGTRRDGQLIRLRSDKCSIGSGPQCTLRLRARGVLPMHCLVVRGSAATIVRRWATDTRLNGRSFDESELVAGDRLSLGPVELVVVDTGAPVRRAAEPAAASPSVASDKQDAQAAERFAARIRTARRQSNRRTRRIVAQSRANLAALNDLKLRHDELTAEAQRLRAAPHSPATDDAASKELVRQRAETERLDGELSQLRKEIDAERTRYNTELAVWQAEKRQWLEQQAAADERLDRQAAELDSLRAALERQVATIATEQAADDDTTSLDSAVEDDAAVEREPADVAAVLRKLGKSPVFDDDEDRPNEPAAVPREASHPAAKVDQGRTGHHDDEESIDDYMAKLLQRVGTEPTVAPKPSSARSGRERSRPVEVDDEETGECRLVPQPNAPPRRAPVEMAPRVVAPEKHAGLSAMRELANLSTQTALRQHSQRVLLGTSRTKLLLAAGGAVIGGILLWMWTSGSHHLALVGALIGLSIAVGAIVQYLMLTGRLALSRLMQRRQATADADAAMPPEVDSPPTTEHDAMPLPAASIDEAATPAEPLASSDTRA
jgi:hypothetical protein